MLGLLWSASKMFGALSRGINLALGIPKDHPFYLSRLRYFAMTVAVPGDRVVAVAVQVEPDGVERLVVATGEELTHLA